MTANKLEKPPETRQAVQQSKVEIRNSEFDKPAQLSAIGTPGELRALAAARPGVVAAYGKLPLSFEVNQGQTNSAVKFMSRGSGYTLFLTGDEAVLGLQKSGARSQEPGARHRRFDLRNRKFEIGNRKLGSANWKLETGKSKFETRNSRFGIQDSEFEIGLPGSLLAGLESPISILESSLPNFRSPISDATAPAPSPQPPAPTSLRMKLVGANPNAVATGADELPGKVNYFIGNDPKKWCTNVPTYAKVKYQSVYPGIDLVYYGNQGGQLEYDFVVAPGADPGTIVLDAGAEEREGSTQWAEGRGQSKIQNLKFKIDQDGDLLIPTDDGEVRFHKPLVYQETRNWKLETRSSVARHSSLVTDHSLARHSSLVARHSVDGRFTLDAENRVHFALGPYDHTQALVIDPVLVYSTYLGGSSEDFASGIAVDASGSAYLTGQADSSNFPTVNPIQTQSVAPDAFVTKLSPSGSALVYSTYLGGSGDDTGLSIAVDSSGNAYVTGYTDSPDFPTVNPFQAMKGGVPSDMNAFVTKLNAAGSALVYSTYLGGSGYDQGYSIAVDSSGSAYVTGETGSTNFPTANPLQAQLGGWQVLNAFVTKFSSSGATLVYSTYLGGNQGEQGFGIAVDSSGNAYVVGPGGLDMPITNKLPPSMTGASGGAFIAKLNAGGSALVYCTLLGGTGVSVGSGIALDSVGDAYVTGYTSAPDFPTVNAFQPNLSATAGYENAFVSKLNPAGSALVYSTYLGGTYDEYYFGNDDPEIAVDAAGDAFVVGSGASRDFPTANPLQATNPSGSFVAEFNPSGGLVFSTHLGSPTLGQGSPASVVVGIAADSSGNAYVTGSAGPNFPTVNPYQATLPGINSAFVAKISPANLPSAYVAPSSITFSPQYVGTTSAAQTVTVTNVGSAPLSISDISGSSAFAQSNNYSSPLQPLGVAMISVTCTPTAPGPQTATLTITDNDSGVPGSTQTVTLTGTGIAPLGGVSSSSLTFGAQAVGTASAPQQVVLSNPTSTAISVSISASAGYLETDNCGGVVAGPGACTINVSFNPAAVGPDNGTLTVAETSNGQPAGTPTVSLTGTGVAASGGEGGGDTPTLPQWAAILMGFALAAVSIFKMRPLKQG